MEEKENKGARLLEMYDRLNKGDALSKTKLAEDYGVTLKTIERDLNDLRAHLAESSMYTARVSIRYDRKKKGYVLVNSQYEHLNNKEVLTIAKILLESRALRKDEMESILDKLINESAPESKETVKAMVKNEMFLYVPLRHQKKLLDILWELSQIIDKKKIISFLYTRLDGQKRKREVKPVAILFSEYYFYLVAYMADDSRTYPTIFRVDRMEDVEETGKSFRIPYTERFSEGEFRKRVQFMYAGPLHTVTFRYKGPSIEAVLDRLPTAEVLEEKNGVYMVQAEVYGRGIDMWLDSQGDKVEVMEAVGK